jgi:hypothetical protein
MPMSRHTRPARRRAGIDLAEGGIYRVFIQFQTAGTLHTAAVTVTAR